MVFNPRAYGTHCRHIPHEKAKKWEEDGVNEVKQTFQREQSVMKAEVDQELSKINDLYHERSRDYAQMVSDECEGEVSKAVAGKMRALPLALSRTNDSFQCCHFD